MRMGGIGKVDEKTKDIRLHRQLIPKTISAVIQQSPLVIVS